MDRTLLPLAHTCVVQDMDVVCELSRFHLVRENDTSVRCPAPSPDSMEGRRKRGGEWNYE